MTIFGQVNVLVGHVDFDHLLVHGQVIKFDNSTHLLDLQSLKTGSVQNAVLSFSVLDL